MYVSCFYFTLTKIGQNIKWANFILLKRYNQAVFLWRWGRAVCGCAPNYRILTMAIWLLANFLRVDECE